MGERKYYILDMSYNSEARTETLRVLREAIHDYENNLFRKEEFEKIKKVQASGSKMYFSCEICENLLNSNDLEERSTVFDGIKGKSSYHYSCIRRRENEPKHGIIKIESIAKALGFTEKDLKNGGNVNAM